MTDPSNHPAVNLGVASVTDDLASAEEIAELRGEQMVWQTLLHQASSQLANLAGYPHSRLCRAALDVAAEHVRSAEKVLRALDDVLDPKQSDAGRQLSTRYLRQRVEREQDVLRQAG
ncbi:hypothetical protein [uncultured Jatrophihabitans sp.]|uniref:hypothetical protein n=1 Tax=uncultured Jatrophihabitans sp. TaxID=1610747 RepID=UPI0035CAA08F